MKQKIIMTYGYPATGKSTLSRKLEQELILKNENSKIVKSVNTRIIENINEFDIKDIDERIEKTRNEKEYSYNELIRLSQIMLNKNEIPILDATFHLKHRRKLVYELAKKNKAELYIVNTKLEKINIIKKILNERFKCKNNKDNVLNTFEAYQLMVMQTEKFTFDEILNLNCKVIEYSWIKKEIKKLNFNGEDLICSILEKI